MILFNRVLIVNLYNFANKKISFDSSNTQQLKISVTGEKYLDGQQPQFIIQITNLDASTKFQIVKEDFRLIEVIAGYRGTELDDTSNLYPIFRGSLMYIGTNYDDQMTVTTKFICTSVISANLNNIVNLSLTSGMNVYQLLQEISRNANLNVEYGVSQDKLDTIYDEVFNSNSTALSTFEEIASKYGLYIDYNTINGQDNITIFDVTEETNRPVWKLNEYTGLINRPVIKNSGTSCSCLIRPEIQIGHYILLNNADINVDSADDVDQILSEGNIGYQIDPEGLYLIKKISYNLNNKEGDFSMAIEAVAKSVILNITGG